MKIDITERTFRFGIKILQLTNKMPKSPAGYRIGGQIVGSGTSIGANVQEAQSANSKKDFIHKMNIALKEARETLYWLKLLDEAKLVLVTSDLTRENEEIVKILIAIIKNTKKNHP